MKYVLAMSNLDARVRLHDGTTAILGVYDEIGAAKGAAARWLTKYEVEFADEPLDWITGGDIESAVVGGLMFEITSLPANF